MATTMDAQISQQDDLGHDTLMGFQELDSHLAIFESTENRRDSSTPGTISTPGFDATIDTIESQPAFENFEHTIVVDTSTDHFQSDIKSRARVIKDPKPSTNGDKNRAARQLKHASDGNIHLQPESARDSLASSMTTDHDDGSSSLSSLSSHPNSPTVDKNSGVVTKASSLDGTRPKYNVRPKESIPTDVHPAEYARQCIAAAESSRLSPYTLHPEEYHMLPRRKKTGPRRTIAVIGAVIVEGRDRVGGRVYSHQFASRPEYPTLFPGSRYTAEMGGMIITGFDRGNPLNIIVRGQLALPYHPLKPDTTIYDDGHPVDLLR
ncbi:Lysine-specific histone demethylase 1A [Botrytis cinerea]